MLVHLAAPSGLSPNATTTSRAPTYSWNSVNGATGYSLWVWHPDGGWAISKNVSVVYIELEPGMGEKVRQEWERWWPDIPLVVKSSPYRSIVGPLLDFLDETDREHNDGQLATVVLPEFVPAHWWQAVLHNQTTWLIKTALLYRRRTLGYQRVIIDIPYHLRK